MADMVRGGGISPVELLDAHLEQIAAANPAVNAFVELTPETARAQARAAGERLARGDAPGLLEGVPVTVKDSFDVAGLPTLCGSKLRLGHRAQRDSTAVARLRAAGAVILGKTNCAEFLMHYETDNYVTGRVNNPWAIDRTAGGSSGGEAAAIAALCSPGGIGSDGGGSIRVPAHFCGIAGLKPTPGRIPATGHFPTIAHPGGLLGVAGPMARTAQDVRLLFSVLAGYDDQDPFSAPVPPRLLSLEGVRIGFCENPNGTPVAAPVREALAGAARRLEEAGFPVEPFDLRAFERAPRLWWFFFGRLPARISREMFRGRESDVHWTGSEFVYRALEEPEPTAQEMLENLAMRDRWRAALLRRMRFHPVLLMAPAAIPAFRHRERSWVVGGRMTDLLEAMAPAVFANVLGLPAVVVPFGMTPDGLPAGIQLVGRPYEEELLLEVAVKLEELRGPFGSPPLASGL
jgi:amidase